MSKPYLGSRSPGSYWEIKLLMAFVIMFYIANPAIQLLRLHHVSYLKWLPTLFSHATIPVITFLCFIYLARRLPVKFDNFTASFLLLGVFGISIGLVRGNGLRDLMADTARVAFVVTVYQTFSRLRIGSRMTEWIIHTLSRVVLGVYILVGLFVQFVSVPSGWALRMGLTGNAMLIPVAYFYWRRKWVGLLISLLVIAASGKRSVVLSVFPTILFLWASRYTNNCLKKVILSIIAGIVALAIILGTAPMLEAPLQRVLGDAYTRWQLMLSMNMSTVTVDLLARLSSGRSEEIIDSYLALKHMPLGLWVGGGHGFTYPYSYPLGGVYIPMRRNVHFSPMGVLSVYGWPATILVFTLLGIRLASLHGKLRRDRYTTDIRYALFAIVIGNLIHACTAYTLLQNPLIWIPLGVLIGFSRRKDST